MQLFAVLISIGVFVHIVHADSIDVCVRCTKPPNGASQCDGVDDKICFTFNELIGNAQFNSEFDSNNFSRNTTISIQLLPGLHLVNSTEDNLCIDEVQSVILSGDGANVNCLSEFSFTFSDVDTYVNISGITFNSCTLKFVYHVGTTFFSHLKFIDSLVEPSRYCKLYAGWDGQYGNELYSNFEIVNSSFLNSRIVKGLVTTSLTSCNVNIIIKNVVFKDVMERSLAAILFLHRVRSVYLTNTTFQNICGSSVEAHFVPEVTLKNVTFVNNRCTGFLLNLQIIDLIRFSGDCTFKYNTNSEGVIIKQVKQVLAFKSRIEFCNNHNDYSEALFMFVGDSNLKQKSLLRIIKSTVTFEDNIARGAIMLSYEAVVRVSKTHLTFKRNTGLFFKFLTTFHSAARVGPGAILLLHGSTDATISNSSVLFSNNSAGLSGGITLVSSTIDIEPHCHIVFEHNEGGDGGGMAFYERSSIRRPFKDRIINLYFNSNRVRRNGGAVFVKDSDYTHSEATVSVTHLSFFVSLDITSPFDAILPTSKIHFHFVNNTAKLAANDLYGGWIDRDRLHNAIQISSTYPENDLHAIASDPTRICMCNNSIPVCNITEHHIKAFPGQRFAIEAVAVGQRMGLVPSSVMAQFNDDEGSLGEGQNIQSVSDKCTSLHFTIFSEMKEKSVHLTIPGLDANYLYSIKTYLNETYHILLEQFSITVELKDCPLGFLFNTTSKTCSCLSSIVHHSGVQCDHDTFTVHRSKYKWIAATFDHVKSQNHGVLVHDQCPRDYCRTEDGSLSIRLESPDSQCAFRRSGDLCGSCQQKLSQVFGTSRCKECSNITVLGVIPGVFLAGLVLIVFIAVLNITVTVGTINGLIFYANVIQASKSIFFRHDNGSSFSSIFIAWLNLDLGIEACFYDGLDAYAKTWLQFAFPIYLWLLLIAIIVSSHYSVRVSKFIPNNALQVLATIFLLSYAKIIRNVIIVFSSTVLTYPDGYEKRVWLYDGNVEFLTGKHNPSIHCNSTAAHSTVHSLHSLTREHPVSAEALSLQATTVDAQADASL